MFAVATHSTHPIARVTFHPNGGTFAVGQPHHGVTLLDRAGGRVLDTIPIPRVADYSSLVFCDDGTRLAIGSLRGVHLFDVATRSLIGHVGSTYLHVAAVADRGQSLIAATRSGLYEIRVPTDTPAGQLRATSLPLQSRATVVALSPCGRWGFGVYGRVRPSLIDTVTGRVPISLDHPLRYDGGNAPAVAFSPNSARLAVCDGKNVSVYEVPPEPDDEDADEPDSSQAEKVAPKPRSVLEPLFVLDRPDGVVPTDRWRPPVAFTPDGRGLLVRRPRNRVQLWDVGTGTQTAEWSWRMDGVTSLAVAPDGLTAVAGARFGRVVVWDLE